MKNLIIDGKDLGPCIGYRQNQERKTWSFLMDAGYYIAVEFGTIKQFTSAGNHEIILFSK